MNGRTKYDLEERLTKFAVLISNLVELLPSTPTGRYLAGQLIRSGISPALNYGEAKSAESMNDFIHNNPTSNFMLHFLDQNSLISVRYSIM